MAPQNLLVLVNGTVQIPLDLPQKLQLFFLLGAETPDVDVGFFQFLHPAFDHLPIILEFFLGVVDGFQIFMEDLLVIANRIIQRISPDLPHGLLDLLKLDSEQVEHVLDLVRRFVIALLFQVHLKDHLMDGQLHIILNFQG